MYWGAPGEIIPAFPKAATFGDRGVSKRTYPPPGTSHDCAAPYVVAARPPISRSDGLRDRHPCAESAAHERLHRVRARRGSVDQLRRVLGPLGPRVRRSRHADAAADADADAHAGWGRHWNARRHAREEERPG